jgi:hypothetical protein
MKSFVLSILFIFIFVLPVSAQTITAPKAVDKESIEYQKVVPEVRTTIRMKRAELENKKAYLKYRIDTITAPLIKELAEVDAALAECDKLGIKSAAVEPIK